MLMAVVQYMTADAAGFIRYPLTSTYDVAGDGEIRRFDGRELYFTSLYSPDRD